jgi:hypothetical protein
VNSKNVPTTPSKIVQSEHDHSRYSRMGNCQRRPVQLREVIGPFGTPRWGSISRAGYGRRVGRGLARPSYCRWCSRLDGDREGGCCPV